MAERGRPSPTLERSQVVLRIPTALIAQVDTFKACLESARGGLPIHRTDLLIRLIEVGLQTLVHARQPALPSSPAPGARQRKRRKGAPAPEGVRGIDAPPPPPSRAVPPHYQSLLQKPRTNAVAPELLEALAAARRQFPHATLRALAQYLYDANLYRARTKTGQEGLVSTSVVDVWLKKAKKAGLL